MTAPWRTSSKDRLYVQQEKVARGLEDVRVGRVLSPEEVERRMAKWTDKYTGPWQPWATSKLLPTTFIDPPPSPRRTRCTHRQRPAWISALDPPDHIASKNETQGGDDEYIYHSELSHQ